MTKKEFINFINRRPENPETFRINNICYLIHYLYRDVDGSVDPEKDILKLEFDTINNVNFSIYDTTIRNRDFELIKIEITALIEKYLDEVKSQLIKEFENGYRNKN